MTARATWKNAMVLDLKNNDIFFNVIVELLAEHIW